MNVSIRVVDASRSWRWIAEGMFIFRKNPGQWLLMIALLFMASRILLLIPVIGAIIAILIAPVLLAGMAHGAEASTEGKPLRLGYVVSGFLKNAAQLITIGGVSLVGQLLTLMAMMLVGGETMSGIAKTLTAGAASPEAVQAVRAGMPDLMLTMLVGLVLSIPVMMAVWFAPLLVFFDDMKPFPALLLSLWACVKNTLPFLLYGLVILAPMMMLMPLTLATGQPDLALWLLAPILVPSIYASYRDLFVRAPAHQ